MGVQRLLKRFCNKFASFPSFDRLLFSWLCPISFMFMFMFACLFAFVSLLVVFLLFSCILHRSPSDFFFRISYFLVCILQRNQIVRHAQPTAKYNQLVVDVKQFFIKCAHVVNPFSTVLPPMTFVCDRYCWIHAFITKSTFVWPCFLRFFWFTLKLALLILGWQVKSIWKHISSTILTWRVLSLAILTWPILMGWALTSSLWGSFLADPDVAFSWNASASGFLFFLFVQCVVALNCSPNSCQFLFNIML